ncbi:transporter substrate-binding domain-containing protein [Streptomyces sp. NPDC018610]|uniref:ABC transporter substrate-binding protein n=1 Tax=Streptomyces sp. NPDC018610 TaxID=3365049 RepID=UPI0037B73E1B
MPTSSLPGRLLRHLTATAAVASLALSLAACGGDSDAATTTGSAADGTVTVGQLSNGAARQTTLKVSEVKALNAELPAAVRESGRLVIGVGALPAGFPPLAYVGSDQKTLTGAEPDLGRLVAAVLGLKPELRDSTWENLFVGVDSGKVDVAFSNVTDTEERKKKYEFASYRQDNLAFEVAGKSTWNFDGDYENLAGRTVAVSSGTNQEKILLEWQAKLAKEGKKLTVKHYQDQNSTYLALAGGRIDIYFGPNPAIAYHTRQTANTPRATRNAGEVSGAGQTLQGLIAATAKKGSGLAEPIADAIDHLIKDGQYAKWLAAWNLSNEAVTDSRVDPPGLPLDNS